MKNGEEYIERIRTVSNNIDSWKLTSGTSSLPSKTSFDYIGGYAETIIHTIRYFVIVNFILSIIYIILEIALRGL